MDGGALAGKYASDFLVDGFGGVGEAVHEISRQNTPTAFDANKELLPCALVQLENETPVAPLRTSTTLFVVVYFYQRFGHETIGAAELQARALLDRQVLQPAPLTGAASTGVVGARNFEVRFVSSLIGMNDQALNSALAISRYVCYMAR